MSFLHYYVTGLYNVDVLDDVIYLAFPVVIIFSNYSLYIWFYFIFYSALSFEDCFAYQPAPKESGLENLRQQGTNASLTFCNGKAIGFAFVIQVDYVWLND